MNIKNKLKQNITLVIGLSIPVFMILFVAASIYLPRFLTPTPQPQFDFIYTPGNSFEELYYYRVENGRLRREEKETSANFVPIHESVERNDVLYIHDISENVSKEISLQNAQKLVLSSSSFSPDGFKISRGRGGGGLFSSGQYDYNTRYLKKDTFFQKLNLERGEYNYYNFQFIGWVVE